MKKPVDFSTYKKIQKMTLNDLNVWVMSIYKSGLNDGVNLLNDNIAAEVSDDRLLEIMLSVKGIGRKRAEQVIEKLLAEGIYQKNAICGDT